MTEQIHIFRQVQQKIGWRDRIFMELVNHPTNPLTNADLKAMIERRPAIYGRYKGFLGKLKD